MGTNLSLDALSDKNNHLSFKKDDPLDRMSMLATFLLGDYPEEDRNKLFIEMQESGLFSEFNVLKNGNGFWSRGYIESQNVLRFKFFENFQANLDDMMVVFKIEKDYRHKNLIRSRIITLTNFRENDTGKVSDYALDIVEKVNTLMSLTSPGEDTIKDAAEELVDMFAVTDAEEEIKTGIDFLDGEYEFVRGNTIAVGGDSNSGKTSLVHHICRHGILQGMKVAFITTEMNHKVNTFLFLNGFAYEANMRTIPIQKLKSNSLDYNDIVYLKDLGDRYLKPGALRFIDGNQITKLTEHNLLSHIGDADIVVVDYFQQLRINMENGFQEGNQLVMTFKHIAEKTNKLVILISQVTDEASKRVKNEQGLFSQTDLKSFKDLSYTPNLILFVYRNPNPQKIGISQVKARYGSTWDTPKITHFNGANKVFGNYVRIEDQFYDISEPVNVEKMIDNRQKEYSQQVSFKGVR